MASSSVFPCWGDNPDRFRAGFICARAAEGVQWAEVRPDASGIKRKRISVLFESFERHSGSPSLAATVKKQEGEIQSLEAELKSLRELKEE